MINQDSHITRKDVNMPCVGLGTMLYPEPEKAIDLIRHALDYGYTHIDTARKYGSENWVERLLNYLTYHEINYG